MLSRLLITGKIDINTPICVILEIADAHGINYDINEINNEEYMIDLINYINSTDTLSIKFPIINLKDYEFLARFINKYVS